jgi:hypothetical protein
MANLGSCSACYYLQIIGAPTLEGGNALGECRRFPPQVNVVATPKGMMTLASFPPVQRHHYCGEWKPQIRE